MEVHAHSHPPSGHKKRWTHYLWEFLMLFLAVFCGFLAENMREHMVDRQREKKYMGMLIEDLATDTTAMHAALIKANTVIRSADSAVVILRDSFPRATMSKELSKLVGDGGQRQFLVITDRTSSQLKNSGALRLVDNEEVTTLILKYWERNAETIGSIDRYMIYRNASRDLLFKLWLVPLVYVAGTNDNAALVDNVKVIDQDPKKWMEFTNLMVMCKAISGNIVKDLEDQLAIARSLIGLIKKKYHFK